MSTNTNTNTPSDAARAAAREHVDALRASLREEWRDVDAERMGSASDAIDVSEAARAIARERVDAMRERVDLAERGHAIDVDEHAERDAIRLEGMRRMSAHAARMAQRVASHTAAQFDVDDARLSARTIDALAYWLGKLPADDAADVVRRRAYMGTLRRIARRHAARMGSGRGTMPRLSHGNHSPLCADGVCVAGCPVAKLEAKLREATLSDRMGARRLNGAERDTLRGTFQFERAERAPMYARWLDAFGDGAPEHGTPHPMAHRAPGVPERDAPSVRRPSAYAIVRSVFGADYADTYAAAIDATRTTTRGGVAIAWGKVGAAVGVHASTAMRRMGAIGDLLRTIDRDAMPSDADGRPIDVDGAPWTAPTRHDCGLAACEHDAPLVDRGPWHTWAQRGVHAEGCERGGACADGCRALRIAAPRMAERSTYADGEPIGSDAICHEHAAGACPIDCGKRAERRERIATIEARYA